MKKPKANHAVAIMLVLRLSLIFKSRIGSQLGWHERVSPLYSFTAAASRAYLKTLIQSVNKLWVG